MQTFSLQLTCSNSFAHHYVDLSQNITWNGPSREVGARETLKAFRKKTSFSLVCRNVLQQVIKKALFSPLSSSCLPSLMPSSNNLPNNSELECMQDHEYSLNRLLSQRRYHVDCLLLFMLVTCSGCCYQVLCVRPHVNVCSFTRNVHPRSNWRERKHCIKVYSSATVVDSTIFSIF